MTSDELTAFTEAIRARAADVSAELSSIDPATLTPLQRNELARLRAVWSGFRELSEADAMEVHRALTELFGELTLDQSIAVIQREYSPRLR